MDRNSNRCANSEALARYERECDKNERIYEQNCEDMNNELDEVIDMYEDIAKRYDLRSEAKEYMGDMIGLFLSMYGKFVDLILRL